MKVLFSVLVAGLALPAFSSWDKIKPSADFRYRLENTKDEYNNEGQSRQRIRARVGLKYEIDSVTNINLRLATAGGATSTNDTLSGGDSDAVYFDQAYLSHKAGDVSLNMGRMKNPMYRAGKNQLLWDGDYNPEGLHAGYTWNGVYVNLGSFWYEENKAETGNDGLDVTITSTQLGYKRKGGKLGYNLGVSNYHYENAHERGSFGDEGMNILETYLELSYDLGAPLTFFASSTVNNEAEEDNKAMIVGFSYGKTKNKGSWKVGANQRTIELNAINTKVSDSDFAAGKDSKGDTSGTIIWGKYMVTDKSYISFGYFQNTINVDEKLDSSKEAEAYNKLQIDYGVKF